MSEQDINKEELRFSAIEYTEGLDDTVITEDDIFKFLVNNGSVSKGLLKENIKRFFNRLPLNIFRDDYYVLYQVLEYTNRYNTFFELEDIYHVIQKNDDNLLKDSNITMFKDKNDEERLERIVLSVLDTYDTLMDMEFEEDSDRLFVNLNTYIQTYVENGLEILHIKLNNMLNGEVKKGNNLRYDLTEIREYEDKVKKLLYGLLDEDLDRLSPEINTMTMGVEEVKEILEKEESNELVSITGVSEMDDTIEGLHRGEYWAVQAGSGVGKTKFMVNMAHNSIINGQNVLIDSIELTSRKMMFKLLAKHIFYLYGYNEVTVSMTEKRLESPNLTVEEKRFYDNALTDFVTNVNYGRCLVTDAQVLVETFESRLETYWDKGFHFDVYALDYVGIVGSKSRMSKHERVTEVSNKLKTLVKNFKGVGFGAIVVNQLSKEGEQGLDDGEGNAKLGAAESMDVRRDCDIQLTLHQTSDMKLNGKMNLIIEKARFHSLEGGNTFEAHVDMSRNVFVTVQESE